MVVVGFGVVVVVSAEDFFSEISEKLFN